MLNFNLFSSHDAGSFKREVKMSEHFMGIVVKPVKGELWLQNVLRGPGWCGSVD